MKRITKTEWQRLGGVANPQLWRKQVAGRWQYYKETRAK